MKAEEIQKINDDIVDNDDYKNMHKIFDKYFRNKPTFDDLEKASYAYHFRNRDDIHAHSFYDNLKSLNLDYADNSKKFLHEKCEWCCQSRIQIRWGDNPKCGSRPKEANGSIAETLKDEETSYFALLERGKDDIPAMVKRKFGGTVSAEALFYCQTTLGYEPDIVSGIMDIDIEKMMPQYEVLMNEHRGKS